MNLDQVQVLLIDDDEDDFVNIRGILSEIGPSRYKLSWESSYESGLRALKNGKYDLCLLDFRLGELTGLDLLRESVNAGIATPIILLTGQGDFETDLKAMQSGAADYLVKAQITAPLLERAIRYAMKHALDMREVDEQRENFKILFNSTLEGIGVHRGGRIVEANLAMEKIFGYGPSEMEGLDLSTLFRSDLRRETQTFLAGPSEVGMETIGLKRDGTEVFLEVSSRTILLKGETISLMAVRDVTQRKQMEAQILQQDRLASLGLLASSLAHEIGTPLGVIRGRAQLISKSDDEKVKSNMEIITKQIDRVSKLVNSLLHIARGGRADFVADVDVNAVIDDVSVLMSHELARNDIRLKIDVVPGLVARSEPGPLGQVILNLMVNSVHAIEDAKKSGRAGEHFVNVTGRAVEGFAEIEIADSGCGISQLNLRNLFKPFFTTKDIGVGTGLGLATSYKLIQSWGGSISVDSEVGAGTSFTIRLPQPKRG